MDTMTSTATSTISNTKLAIATLAMLAAGGAALAAVPLSSSGTYGYGYGGCTDYDNYIDGYGYSYINPFNTQQLFTKSATRYNNVVKTDYCYTFPATGKTYLMESVCYKDKFATWQKNCAELNLGKPGNNFKCVEGACVNMVDYTQGNLLITKNTNSPTTAVTSDIVGLAKFDLIANFNDINVNNITVSMNGADLSKVKNIKLSLDGSPISDTVAFSSSSISFPVAKFTVLKNSTRTLYVLANLTALSTGSSTTLQVGVSKISASDAVTGGVINVNNLPVLGNQVSIVPCYKISGLGQRVKVGTNPAVWYVDSGIRHYFVTTEIYKSWFVDYSGVQTISGETFYGYQEGGTVCMNLASL